jgi:hypothetical protein
MSPKARGDWKPPRDRREVLTAVLAALAIVVVVASLVWFLRPNRESASSPAATTPAPTSSVATTTAPGASTTVPPTSTPSTPSSTH